MCVCVCLFGVVQMFSFFFPVNCREGAQCFVGISYFLKVCGVGRKSNPGVVKIQYGTLFCMNVGFFYEHNRGGTQSKKGMDLRGKVNCFLRV